MNINEKTEKKKKKKYTNCKDKTMMCSMMVVKKKCSVCSHFVESSSHHSGIGKVAGDVHIKSIVVSRLLYTDKPRIGTGCIGNNNNLKIQIKF